jgi:LacI family transcriptional regulator
VRPLREELAAFAATGGRVAVVGRHHLRVDAVVPDNRAGGHTIGAHVAGLGHRRIAIASGPRWLTTIEDRLAGMFAAFGAAGIDVAELPVVEAEFNVDGGYAATDRILAEHPDATAIVALNDAMAIGVLNRLREDAAPIPERFSVTGFDDVGVAASLAPGLTTIRLPMADFGRIAVELALDAPAARPRRRRTSHRLVVRASTGPPRVS